MFESILKKDSTNSGMILSKDYNFSLDITTVESHQSKLRVTENPIENGANIADHAVLDPKEVTIYGLVVSYEPSSYTLDSVTGYNFSDYQLPVEVKAITAQSESVLRRLTAYYQTVEKEANNVIADFLPDYQSPILNGTSSDRIEDAYNKLLAIQKSGEPVTLQTSSRQYKNMIITSVGLSQQKESCGEFTLTFREVFIVETKKEAGLHVKKRNLGITQPVKLEGDAKLSVLEGLSRTAKKVLF